MLEASKIQITKMQEKDCEAVSALFAACFTDPWSLSSVKEMFSTQGYYNLLAWKEKEICGYIGIKAVLDEADIVNVAVSPAYREQRIATQLLKALLEEAKKENIAHIYLEVRQHNIPAIHLYEQAGFVHMGIRKNYYKNPSEHAVIMVWE